jgi:4-hydroxy-3-methylbut-2-en-1-yl diphosphate reductase
VDDRRMVGREGRPGLDARRRGVAARDCCRGRTPRRDSAAGRRIRRAELQQLAATGRRCECFTPRVAYLTQTTLSLDDTEAVIEVLRRRFPAIEAPAREDICYATTNRQRAAKAMLGEIDLLLVIGSRNSSNSNRLVEVARSRGVAAHLIDDESEIDEAWLSGVETVGVTAGASAPESLVSRVVSWFRERGVEEIKTQDAESENVSFRAPAELRSSSVVA